MKILVTGDFHLTDNPEDEYRWDIFDWLITKATEYDVDHIIHLGDITEKKDKHSSILVNRVFDKFHQLSSVCTNTILMGNHDFIDPKYPFFEFLGMTAVERFITVPKQINDALFLPYSLNPEEDWKDLPFGSVKYIFAHQGVVGGMYSNGRKEEESCVNVGEDFFKTQVFSGHIHVPQTIGKVTYVGSPHSVDYGDDYDGRVLFIDTVEDTIKSIPYTSMKKWSIKVTSDTYKSIPFEELNKDDRVKFEVYLNKSEIEQWSEIKEEITKKIKNCGAVLSTIELKALTTPKAQTTELIKKAKNNEEVVLEFAKKEELGYKYAIKALELVSK